MDEGKVYWKNLKVSCLKIKITDKCITLEFRPHYEASWVLLHCFNEINIKLNYLKYESFMRKKNQDCLFSLKTITEEFDFVIFGETSLNVHNMSSNHLLVHRLLCCIFMISFFFLRAVYLLTNLGFFYFLNHNICKIII